MGTHDAKQCTCTLFPVKHDPEWHDQVPLTTKCPICHMPDGAHKLDCPNGR